MKNNLGRRGFSERKELDLDNIVITGGFDLCISSSRDVHRKKLTQLYTTQVLRLLVLLRGEFLGMLLLLKRKKVLTV